MKDDARILTLTVDDLYLIAEALDEYARIGAAEAARLGEQSNDEDLPVFERARAIVEACDVRSRITRCEDLAYFAERLADRAALRARR